MQHRRSTRSSFVIGRFVWSRICFADPDLELSVTGACSRVAEQRASTGTFCGAGSSRPRSMPGPSRDCPPTRSPAQGARGGEPCAAASECDLEDHRVGFLRAELDRPSPPPRPHRGMRSPGGVSAASRAWACRMARASLSPTSTPNRAIPVGDHEPQLLLAAQCPAPLAGRSGRSCGLGGGGSRGSCRGDDGSAWRIGRQ